jgi:hypothetical protein
MPFGSTGFVGLDPVMVEQLVEHLHEASAEILALVTRADTALERVAGLASTAWTEPDRNYLRSIAFAVEDMAGDAARKLREFEDAERFERIFAWSHLGLGAVSTGVSEVMKEAEHWLPGHWQAGEWIEGYWQVEAESLAMVGEGVEAEATVLRATHVPGGYGPRTWIGGEEVASEGMRSAGKVLGVGAAALDVGIAGWEDWGEHSDLHGAERFGHAAWAAATLGGGSAAGTYAGYMVGAAAVAALIAAAPIAIPAAGAIAVVGGIGGAMIGSKLGHQAGSLVKTGLEDVGGAAVSGVKKVFGMFG